jgi:hypothetical protein
VSSRRSGWSQADQIRFAPFCDAGASGLIPTKHFGRLAASPVSHLVGRPDRSCLVEMNNRIELPWQMSVEVMALSLRHYCISRLTRLLMRHNSLHVYLLRDPVLEAQST